MLKYQLTDKEQYFLWCIACWFDRPIITEVLKHKLYIDKHDLSLTDERARDYDRIIEDRIIALGKRLESMRFGKE